MVKNNGYRNEKLITLFMVKYRQIELRLRDEALTSEEKNYLIMEKDRIFDEWYKEFSKPSLWTSEEKMNEIKKMERFKSDMREKEEIETREFFLKYPQLLPKKRRFELTKERKRNLWIYFLITIGLILGAGLGLFIGFAFYFLL